MPLDELFDEYKVPDYIRPGLRRGVEALDFNVEGFVIWTSEHTIKLKEIGRTFKDLDAWLEDSTTYNYAPVVPDGTGDIQAIWCFEDKGDAAMFKLTFCSV